MSTIKRRHLLTAVLAAGHALGVLSPGMFPSLAPVTTASIYLPLLALKSAGLPIYAAGSSGWDSPSLLGWVLVALLWLAIWRGVSQLAAWGWYEVLGRR